jgi:hypothetical protein
MMAMTYHSEYKPRWRYVGANLFAQWALNAQINYHRSNAPRWNAEVDAPASSLLKANTVIKHNKLKRGRWSVLLSIPTRSVGTINKVLSLVIGIQA